MKYSFTGETKVLFGVTLKRIKRDDTGEVGGWIEKDANLSVSGNAWVSGNAQVFGDALVSGNAQVFGNAQVSGDARVFGNAQVSGDARVFGAISIMTGVYLAVAVACLGHADGYGKALCNKDGVAYIGAGCRWFTLAEALRHWDNKPDRIETMCLMQSAIYLAGYHGLAFE